MQRHINIWLEDRSELIFVIGRKRTFHGYLGAHIFWILFLGGDWTREITFTNTH